VATINTIDPTKSKRTGDIPFTIIGTGFETTNLSNDFSGGSFYTDASANGGIITDTDYLSLYVDATSGSLAGINTDHIFERSFDVAILHNYDITTFPSIDDAKIVAIQAFDDLDPTTYFEISVGYKDNVGYFINVQAVIAGTTEYNRTTAIDPRNVEGLKIIRSESRMTGYIKISGEHTAIGDYLGFSIFDSRIKVYSSNSSIPVSGSFFVNITEYNVSHAVSLVDTPASIISISDTEVEGRTLPGEIGTGDLVLGLSDGTFAELLNGFEYTEKQGINRDIKNFDMIISIFNFHIKPSRNELFTSAGSFIWDENYWIDPDKQNKNLYIPSLWDPVTANVPSAFLQSGYGDHENVKLIDIKQFKAESLESWHARINHGTYYIKNTPYFLYSNQSIPVQLGPEQTTDGRSKQSLIFLPKLGIPISASTLTTDIESGLIVDKKRFSKRGQFTGIVQNGIELNTDIVTNIDKTQNEFIVKYNSNNMVTNWRLPTEGSATGLFVIQLPSNPLRDYSVIFSRTDIFSNEKNIGRFYGDAGTIYGQSYYGDPLESEGDYAVDYATGEVYVILDQAYVDVGYITYTFDYPAIIEFNDDYLTDNGVTITDPEPSDLIYMDEVGESNGGQGQIFRLKEFPILDFSDSQFLDRDHFRLYLYDESDNTFETDWIRVRRIEEYGPSDKVYQLNPDQGTIVFGNGIYGKIPQKYKKIVTGYKTSVRIEYEPVSSVDYWVGRDTDLNLSRNSLNSGFLYLSRKELIPDTISIEFATNEINALEFTELSAIVRDRDGDPVPFIELTFDIVNGNGDLEEETIVTNSNGEAKTTFIPSSRIEDMAVFTYLFDPGPTSEILGDERGGVYFSTGTSTNNMIIAEETIEDAPEEIYLFKIYDDNDPFLSYNNATREGGTYQVLHEYDSGTGSSLLIKPIAINGKVLIFEDSLPQPFSVSDPYYEPNLRGFAIIGKKKVQAQARVDAGLFSIDSDLATLAVGYASIQKGEWTLPILPTDFDGSEIDRATYITINP